MSQPSLYERAVKACGTPAELARRISAVPGARNCSPQAISQWITDGIPVTRAQDVEQATDGAVSAIDVLEAYRARYTARRAKASEVHKEP